MKRILSFALALSMVVGLMAGLAVSTSAAVDDQDHTVIENIAITNVAKPVAGQMPQNLEDIDADCGDFTITYVDWSRYNYETSNWVGFGSSAFAADTVYSVVLWLEAKDGYCFDKDTMENATVADVQVSHYWDEQNDADYNNGAGLSVVFLPEGTELISNIVIEELPAAQAGTSMTDLSAIKVPENAHYVVDTDSSYFNSQETVMQAGGQYDLHVKLAPKAGYWIADGATVRGPWECSYTFASYDEGLVFADFAYDLRQKVTEAAITGLKAPAYGEAFDVSDFTIPENANYDVDITWEYYDGEQDEDVEVTSGTYAYTSYTLNITITPKEGYILAFSDLPTINGTAIDEILWVDGEGYMLEGWQSERRWDNDEDEFYFFLHTTIEPENGYIDDVQLTGLPEGIEAGQTITAPTLTAGDGMTVTDVKWLESGEAVTGKFEAGKAYYLQVSVKADQGCAFDTDADMYGDNYVYSDDETVSADHTVLTGYFRYSLIPTVDRVDLTLTEPAAGAAPGAVTLPSGAKYEFYTYGGEFAGYEWEENGNRDEEVTQFEAGKVYNLNYELVAVDGYEFAEYMEVYVNGELMNRGYFGMNVHQGSIRFSLKKQIDRVDVTVPEYKLGDVPQKSDAVLPADADYVLGYFSVSSRLHDTDYTQGLQKDRYRLEINLNPKEGCEFTEDVKMYLNGKEITDGYNYYHYATMCYEISFCDKITSVAFPALPALTLGEEVGDDGPYYPDFVAPEGANYELMYEWMQADEDSPYLSEYEGTIENGSHYWLMYAARPKEGYEFAEDAVATVDGVQTEMMMTEPDGVVGVKQYVFGLKVIDKIEIITNKYAVGGEMGEITVPENANYTLVQAMWGVSPDGTIENTGNVTGNTFEAGKYYLIGAVVTPKEGYVFAQDAAITVNGAEVNIDVNEMDNEMLPTNGNLALIYHVLNKDSSDDVPAGDIPTGDNPPTGDNAPIALVVALAVLSAGGMVVLKKKEF